MELTSLTTEGRILLTLKHGKHTYSELKFETELSDRWLTIKLKELESKGVMKKDGKWYCLNEELTVSPYELGSYMSSQAKRMATELAHLHFIEAIILFGGAAQKKANEYSDLDMIIVVSDAVDEVKEEIISKISELEWNYHLMIDAIIFTTKDFLGNVHSQDGGIVYGLAEGFEVLVDKNGIFTQILHDRIEKIKRSCEYLEEGRIWLRVR